MDALFRQSGRMRAKWDEVHSSDGRTYGEMTIASAVEACRDVYKGNGHVPDDHTTGDANTPDAAASKPVPVPPEPKKIRPVQPYRPFPTHVLPRVLARFVREAAASIGCDESFVALPMLAGLAGMIGNTRRARIKFDWSEPAVLWTVIVAESGARKSPPIDKALRPVHDMQAEAMKEFNNRLIEYKLNLEEHRRKMKAYHADGAEGEPPREPEKPVPKRIVVEDITTEALADRLANAPRGLRLARDELSGWIGGFDAYKPGGKGADASRWLQIHRAGVPIVDRKTGDRPTIFVRRAAVSVTGTIQPRVLGRCLGGEHFENGLAARLLLAMPPARKRVWTDEDINPHTANSLAAVYAELSDLGLAADDSPLDLPLDAGAQAAFVAFVNANGEEQFALDDDDLRAAWSKLEGAAARLALVIQLVRAVTEAGVDAERIDKTSIDAGLTLSRWFGYETRRVYAAIRQGPDERAHQWLIDLIRQLDGRITPRELQRRQPGRFSKAKDARAALMALVTAGLGKFTLPASSPKGGRPSEVFVLTTDPADETPAGEPVDNTDIRQNPESDAGNGVLSIVSIVNAPTGGGSVNAPPDVTNPNDPPPAGTEVREL